MTENGLGRCSEAVLRARFSIEQLIEKCALGRTYLDKTQVARGRIGFAIMRSVVGAAATDFTVSKSNTGPTARLRRAIFSIAV
jgi:hypothetical protein